VRGGGRPLTRGQKLSNKALAAVRAPVEHGFAHWKNWRVLGKVRTDPKWAIALVRALLVLTNREATHVRTASTVSRKVCRDSRRGKQSATSPTSTLDRSLTSDDPAAYGELQLL